MVTHRAKKRGREQICVCVSYAGIFIHRAAMENSYMRVRKRQAKRTIFHTHTRPHIYICIHSHTHIRFADAQLIALCVWRLSSGGWCCCCCSREFVPQICYWPNFFGLFFLLLLLSSPINYIQHMYTIVHRIHTAMHAYKWAICPSIVSFSFLSCSCSHPSYISFSPFIQYCFFRHTLTHQNHT